LPYHDEGDEGDEDASISIHFDQIKDSNLYPPAACFTKQ